MEVFTIWRHHGDPGWVLNGLQAYFCHTLGIYSHRIATHALQHC